MERTQHPVLSSAYAIRRGKDPEQREPDATLRPTSLSCNSSGRMDSRSKLSEVERDEHDDDEADEEEGGRGETREEEEADDELINVFTKVGIKSDEEMGEKGEAVAAVAAEGGREGDDDDDDDEEEEEEEEGGGGGGEEEEEEEEEGDADEDGAVRAATLASSFDSARCFSLSE